MQSTLNNFTFLLPVLGLLSLCASLVITRSIIKEIAVSKRIWRVLFGLIVFFVLGYLAFIQHLLVSEVDFILFTISAIFCGNGFFVLLVTFASQKTLITTNQAYKLEKQNLQLFYEATHDGLTKLLNRTAFEGALEHALGQVHRGGPASALIFADLNKFKKINDTYGHQAGDYVLKKIASIFTHRMRKVDSACRFGGDEFVLLFYNTTYAQGEALLEELSEAISRAIFKYDQHQLEVSCSFGMALVDQTMQSVGDVLKKADEALYQMKRR